MLKMAIYSYIITRDYGFAPNPFYGICTLATCKPRVRNNAQIGDWVLGFGSGRKGSNYKDKLIFAMKVCKKITFDEYWQDPKYESKKPVANGSLKQNYGDNIYHKINNVWVQENSHHSMNNGAVNIKNLERDTKSQYVLLGEEFWYFGKEAVSLPDNLKFLIPKGRDYTKHKADEEDILAWLNREYPEKGYLGEPDKFSLGNFERYEGE